MTQFRLSWARQRGERKAKEHGFETFPVDPFAIAENEDIVVMPKAPDQAGVSGGIIFDPAGTAIFYATNITSEGFQRFTVAHELGHYFLDGHPEEIMKLSPLHVSRAGFTQGDLSIEVEADHFASGLLLPTRLVRQSLDRERIGLEAIEVLAEESRCSLTACGIRAAECSPYPMAIVVSKGTQVSYAFMSDSFKQLGRVNLLRKGSPLPDTATARFNRDPDNVTTGRRTSGEATLSHWFEGSRDVHLDEQVVGLGTYGYTLSVLSGDHLPSDPDEGEDEDAQLIESYTPKFAYGR